MEPVLLPVPRCKGLRIALSVKNEQRRNPTKMIYTTYPFIGATQILQYNSNIVSE
ncbi:MAG: hypothetical protein IIV71_01145 [Bacteroidaceae bacterium]|nr:hypothetical protein [Bacteroidaceae bacterium]